MLRIGLVKIYMCNNLHINNEWLMKQFEQKRSLEEVAKDIDCSIDNVSCILFYQIRKQLLRQLRQIDLGVQDIHYFDNIIIIEVNNIKLIKHEVLKRVQYGLEDIGYKCKIVIPCRR